MSAVGDEDVNVNVHENENEVGVSVGVVSMAMQQKRRWIKYYCEECKAWETREMFEVAKIGPAPPASSPPPDTVGLWSFGCSKLVRHATFVMVHMEDLINADGHDVAPNLDFPNPDDPPSTEPVGEPQPRLPGNREATEEVSELQTSHAALQSRQPKRNADTSVTTDKDVDTSVKDEEKNKDPKRIKMTEADATTDKDADTSVIDEEENKGFKHIKIADITRMSVQKLKEALHSRGLSWSGTRAKLVERLIEAQLNDKVDATTDKDGNTSVKDEKKKDPKHMKIADITWMSVQELRDALLSRGFSNISRSNRAELVERLTEALKNDKADGTTGKDADTSVTTDMDADTHVTTDKDANTSVKDEKNKDPKHMKIADITWMSVQELRDALLSRGLSKTGKRAELVERLTEALKNDKADGTTGKDADTSVTTDKDADTSVKDDKDSKVVVGLKKGDAVLDQYLADNLKQTFHVYAVNDNNNVEVYDAMLNQTNLGRNNNKFYVIQVLESDASPRSYYCFSRWGRVGVKGQQSLQGPFTDAGSAVAEFHAKFYSKTKNAWSLRQDFVVHPSCYTWIEMDYEEEKSTDQDGKQEKPESKEPVEVKPSKLEPRVKQFIDLICNIKMMNQMMMEIGYDARKMPLGKLSKSTILKGYEVLKRLSEALNDKSSPSKKKELIQELTSEFYTVIPHDFGFKHMTQFIIDTQQKLKAKLEMVEALGEIELATKLLSNDIPEDDDPAYTHYKRLHCEFEPLDTTSAEYELVKQYTEKTHGETHCNYTLELLNVFKLQRDGELERFKPFEKNPNRMLLWHGSRLTNWTGILSQGLRIAPPEAPVTGYMFGKGVYFADMVSKSANYCCTHPTDPVGVLLLSEVALGDMRELYNSDYNANNLPNGKLSTKGVGKMIPDPKDYKTLEDGVVVPVGKPVTNDKHSGNHCSLMYNEYIVYDPAQIRMRYLLQVRFNYKGGRTH